MRAPVSPRAAPPCDSLDSRAGREDLEKNRSPAPGAIMRRSRLVLLAVLTLVTGLLLGTGPASSAPPDDRLDVYEGTLTPGQVDELVSLGIDRHDLRRTGSRVSAEPRPRSGSRRSSAAAGQSSPQGRRHEPEEGRRSVRQASARPPPRRRATRSSRRYARRRRASRRSTSRRLPTTPASPRLVNDRQDDVNGQDIVALKVTKERAHARRTAASRPCSTSAPSTPASGSRRR